LVPVRKRISKGNTNDEMQGVAGKAQQSKGVNQSSCKYVKSCGLIFFWLKQHDRSIWSLAKQTKHTHHQPKQYRQEEM